MKTTPEKSVEEIVEEAITKGLLDDDLYGKKDKWLTQTLQAERQKRDEMVEAERLETINKVWQEMSRGSMTGDWQEDLRITLDKIAQPTNPK